MVLPPDVAIPPPIRQPRGNHPPGWIRLAVFLVSLHAICAELFYTRMLGLKTQSHVVYVIISFALLGYGIGANAYVLLRRRIERMDSMQLTALTLGLLGILSAGCALALVPLPIRLGSFWLSIQEPGGVPALLGAYTLVMLPFTAVGFFLAHAFSSHSSQSPRLYLWDLAGAAAGAGAFFVLIGVTQVFRSLCILSLADLILGMILYARARRPLPGVGALFTAVAAALVFGIVRPEPEDYTIDKVKGWEFIPGHFAPADVETVARRWHPLGRTDVYRFINPDLRTFIYDSPLRDVFEINLQPVPEFSYFTTNYLAGTPVFDLRSALEPEGYRSTALWSVALEFPYLLLDRPRVMVVGTGGGRDIFMALTHGAAGVLGAEINPSTCSQMSRGGALFEYSGGIYERAGVQVRCTDGRHMVKIQPENSLDLLILNAVDTFAGLSSGAYVFAEAYLYTKEAILDYVRAAHPKGLVNINRWFGPGPPRENLRLFSIVLDSLRHVGMREPWKHVLMVEHRALGMMLVRKTPFTSEEIAKLHTYLKEHEARIVFAPGIPAEDDPRSLAFHFYANAFQEGRETAFQEKYPADISVVTDDNPFFYKWYKFRELFTGPATFSPHTGTGVFLVQVMILAQCVLFIAVFILLPLLLFNREGKAKSLAGLRAPFAVYFASLGCGFIFVEIALMQKFVLLLGSPIYSISITLATILACAGGGSALAPQAVARLGSPERLIRVVASGVVLYLVSLVLFGTPAIEACTALPFWARVLVTVAFIAPLGIGLGVFYPAGLVLAGRTHPGAVSWAQGINSGFTVLGSILIILLAQFSGFNTGLLCAAGLYAAASVTFGMLADRVKGNGDPSPAEAVSGMPRSP